METRLDSWKEIATYLKRDVSTVQRWEKREGLPIHRHQHGKLGSVYAYKAELDVWWEAGRRRIETDQQDGRDEPRLETSAQSVQSPNRPRRWWVLSACAAGLLIVVSIAASKERPSERLWAALWDAATGASTPRFILVGAFDNATGDHRVDDVLQVAFSQELMQSRALTIVPPERIDDALRLMKRPSSVPLDARTAREVCLRDGEIPLFAAGRIDRLGTTYTIHATIAQASTGAPVAQASIDVAGIDGVLNGVRTLAVRIRTAVGDDRLQVEADARLERVTTGSLDALREYTAGMGLVNERRWAAAEVRLAEAVRVDPSFASALMMLAETRRTLGRPSAEYRPEGESAFHLAAGLPARERYFIQGSYYEMTGDRTSAIAALEALTREFPNDYWGLNNLALAYAGSGRYREENAMSKRMAALRPNDFLALLENAAALITNGDGLENAHTIIARASRLQRPGGLTGDVYSAWLDLFPAFEAWAEGRITDAAALLDALATAAPADDRHAYGLGQMNLALGRVRAAERAFQSMTLPAERTALLAHAALVRGDTSGARAALVPAAPHLTVAPVLGLGSFGRAAVICWSLLRTGFVEECRRLGEQPPLTVSRWIAGELAAATGDYDTALPILQDMREKPPGTPQKFVALDTLAGIFEQRGDLKAAADTLRQSDGAQVAVYPQSGPGAFFWLQARAHLLNIERRLGHRERSDALVRELHRFLAVADPDFVVRQAVH